MDLNLGTNFLMFLSCSLIGLIFLYFFFAKKYYLKCFAFFLRCLLGLRYQVDINGLKGIKTYKGNLILPNHPAAIDPVINMLYLWSKFHPRPVVDEAFYNMPGLNRIFRIIKAIPMPDLRKGSGPWKRRKVEKTLEYIAAALENGDNILFYPAGKLKTSAREIIGGTYGTRFILDRSPNAGVILVRSNGLYGSRFSTVVNGGVTPDIVSVLKKSILTIIRNLILFVPRRSVSVNIEPAPVDFPRDSDVSILNNWLETYYNLNGDEPVRLVSYNFWKEDPKEPENKKAEPDISDVSEDIIDKVKKQLADMCKIQTDKIRMNDRFNEDLGLDSLSMMELVVWLNMEFEISDVEASEIPTVGLLVKVISGYSPEENTRNKVSVSIDGWNDTGKRKEPELGKGRTIIEKFMNTCDRMGNVPAVADDRSGILSWKRMKIGVIAMARELAQLDGDNIGVMVPASVGASIALLAVQAAGKTPVMLNWTMGRKNLEHAIDISGVKYILTSDIFLEKIDVDVSFLEDRFIFLENIRSSITLFKRLNAVMWSWKKSEKIICRFASGQKCGEGDYLDDIALVLFTSGSESAPKGVPLSHKNILSNIESVQSLLTLSKKDVLYGFLPPFHSFGLTVTTLLPILMGMKTVFHPNPTESRKIAYGCDRWGVSIMCGTPTFLLSILKSGDPENFSSLRFMVSGAEKAPDILFEKVKNINARLTLLEGYGITECSPVVCANRPNEDPVGVGKPLPGVELLIVDEVSHRVKSVGERGLILVRGDSIFSGYLGSISDPFVTIEGEKWYNTGDLGFLENASLKLAGRLKRFIKIGGEMISLPALEEALIMKFPKKEDGPVLAISAKENNDGTRPVIALFSTIPKDTKEVNDVLREAGFSPLVSIKKVFCLKNIPILGTGKTDYVTLNNMMNE